ACADAVARLGEIAGAFRDVGWQRCDSVYYAGRPGHAARLAREFALRKRHGFDVEWLDAARLRERYGFAAAAAIVNRPAAALDPYRLTNRLLQRLRRNGNGVHERSRVERIEVGRRDVRLHTSHGAVVRAGHVVVAAGYASQRWLREHVARNRSSYAFVSEPVDAAALGPLRRTLLWESSRPYLYLRCTRDGRVIVGGEDDALDLPARRDRRVARKALRLLDRAQALFPRLPLQPAFCWGGTFAETRDGLPWFGPHPQYGRRVLFALAYGGNGITFSVLGAGLLRALIERRAHPLRELFGFGRRPR
ncbi:NAD(P)/FAD-dependent oxidoreductase, partial [Tahibacter caeni]|uniref:NAD(P)/FAD-dependent oxidoreductase n=1 Tax=Tahibacter caeni TaxID=1453545 RepID=UPI0021496712